MGHHVTLSICGLLSLALTCLSGCNENTQTAAAADDRRSTGHPHEGGGGMDSSRAELKAIAEDLRQSAEALKKTRDDLAPLVELAKHMQTDAKSNGGLPRSAEAAMAASLISQLQTIRSQLELYQVQHGGRYPSRAQMWDNLLTATDAAGKKGGRYGPYLSAPPMNPFEQSSSIGTKAGPNVGWVYDARDGSIKACISAAQAAKSFGRNTGGNDLATY